mmetsp:Transcript_3521/g.12414  ORF Transcript_3521/g.12414 Transcript_3521/m.12414 type:complete len:206 (-) Transcript_3521:1329-1946(-)
MASRFHRRRVPSKEEDTKCRGSTSPPRRTPLIQSLCCAKVRMVLPRRRSHRRMEVSREPLISMLPPSYARSLTAPVCPTKDATGVRELFLKSQILIVLSKDPLTMSASRSCSEEMLPECPRRTPFWLPVCVSNTATRWSRPPLTRLSSLNASAVTRSSWPNSWRWQLPVVESHTMITPVDEADATIERSTASVCTAVVWPLSTRT